MKDHLQEHLASVAFAMRRAARHGTFDGRISERARFRAYPVSSHDVYR